MTDPATRSVVVERELPHPPEKVWRALTQGPLLAEWLMQNDFQPVAGHKFTFRAKPMPHWNGVTDCAVLAVERNRLLSYTWNASGNEAATGLKTQQNYQGAQYGWQRNIANLERVVAGLNGR